MTSATRRGAGDEGDDGAHRATMRAAALRQPRRGHLFGCPIIAELVLLGLTIDSTAWRAAAALAW